MCHGLRHTANDLPRRVASGEVVRAIIGHAATAMTHHDSHVGEIEKRVAAIGETRRRKRGWEMGSRALCPATSSRHGPSVLESWPPVP